jgi:hypothetical protein
MVNIIGSLVNIAGIYTIWLSIVFFEKMKRFPAK